MVKYSIKTLPLQNIFSYRYNDMNDTTANKLKVHMYSFLTILLWGSSFPFTRVIGSDISSYSLGFIRCFLAAVILLIIGKACHIRKPFCRKDLLWFFLSGILGFSVYFIFFNLGMATLTSATGSIITAASPILTAIAAMKLYDERINLIGWLSIICAFAGVLILILWEGVLSINTGIFWMLGVALVFSAYNLLNRKFSEMGYTAMEIVTYSALFGAIQMLIFLPQTISDVMQAPLSSNLAALYLGVMPSAVAYFFWSKALVLTSRTSEVTNYLFINPLMAAVIGFIMLGETPDMGTYIGGAVIIISVIVFTLKGSPEERLP